jgi:hypothetical protein
MVSYTDQFSKAEPALNLQNKPYLVKMYYRMQFVKILLRIFESMFMI